MKMRAAAFAFWIGLAAVTIGTVAVQATVSTTAPRNDYVGTGATATYSYTFRIFAATDLRVTTRNTAGVETTLTYPTDYTVTGVNRASGGTIVLTAGNLTTDYALTIRFDRTPRQSTDLRNQGSFLPQTHEDKFDELTRYAQQHEDVIARSLHLPETEVGTSAATMLPGAASRASQYLAFDASGNPIAASSVGSTPVSAYMQTVLDDTSAAAARATLGAVANTSGEMTDRLTITGDASTVLKVPGLFLNTTHATEKRAFIQFLKNGTTKWLLGSDYGGIGDNNFVFHDAENSLTRLEITSAGVVSLPTGQLKFPAAQNASSEVNTLDDYEEGTWTPSVGGTATYTTQTGTYTKIGRLVTVHCNLTINAIGSGSQSIISGLPFASVGRATGAVTWNTAAASYTTIVAVTTDGTTTATLFGATAAAASIAGVNALQNATNITFTLTYNAAT